MQIRVQQLKHIYKSPSAENHKVLDIPAWKLAAGQQILVRGVSGSGKTTLFNIIAGLMKPTGGVVYYDDTAIYSLPEAQRDRLRAQYVGYVFQTHYLLNTLTALENVVMPMMFAGAIPPEQRRKHAKSLLAQVGLEKFENYRPSQLSTGQRMRVSVARALANQPSLILADEPTAALDTETGLSVMALLQEACRQQDAILLVASHDPLLLGRFNTVADLKAGLLTISEKEPEPV